MTAPILRIPPELTVPPHGPLCPCLGCARLRRAIGHVSPGEYRRRKEAERGA